MRRILILFLCIALLVPFIPSRVEGASFVKEIDVNFNNLKLQVNGKNIIHNKDIFSYDDEFFVSLGDLAKGLKMGLKVKSNSIYLDSKGILDKELNKSTLFQRGYEILAKEKIVQGLEDDIYILNGKDPTRTEYMIKSIEKTISVRSGGVSIYIDGKKVDLETEPIKYKNDFYVSLDSISPYLYITPTLNKERKYINIDANEILVKSNTLSPVNTLISLRKGRNYLLDLKMTELEKKKYFLKEFKLPYKKISNVKSLEDYLNTNLNKVGDLTVNFKVEKSSNLVKLDISFPSSRNYLWYRLKRSELEGWILNVYNSITNLYDSNLSISGVIKNPNYVNYSNSSLKNYLSFYSKNNDLYFDFTYSNLSIGSDVKPSYLMEYLNKNFHNSDGMDFSYDANISGDDIELIITPESISFKDWDVSRKMRYLNRLKEKIKIIYSDTNIYGKVSYKDDKFTPLDFTIIGGSIRSSQLIDETVQYLNNNFWSIYPGFYDFKLSYSLFEKDLNSFHLIVESNFSVDDSVWTNSNFGGYNIIDSRINSSLFYIKSIWGVDVSAEVFDKNGVLIKEY